MDWAFAAAAGLWLLGTMARDLTFYDSPELALVALGPGLGHPPGQPVHTLLGWLVSKLPLVPGLVAITGLSAAAGAMSVLVGIRAAGLLAPRVMSDPKARVLAGSVLLCGVVHFALWEPFTRVEVYPLAALAGLVASWAVGVGRWRVAGVALGLAAGANPAMAVVAGLSALALVLAAGRARAFLAVIPWAAVTTGLAYLYLPLAPVVGRGFLWGDTGNWAGLVAFVTGADYSTHVGVTPTEILSHLWALAGWAFDQVLVPWIAVGLAGWWLRARSWVLVPGLALGVTGVLLAQNKTFFTDNPDYMGYLALPILLLLVGVASVVARASTLSSRGWLVVALLVGMGPSFLAEPAPWSRTRAVDRVARGMATIGLREAPPGAFVILRSDHWIFPVMYLQEVEGLRDDVVVIARGLVGASWYWRQVFEKHPDLARFPLRGPGRDVGRLRRMFGANPGRAVLVEDWDLARSLGVRVCEVGLLLTDTCPGEGDGHGLEVDQWLVRGVEQVGRGSPPSDQVLARLGLVRGEALLRLGRGREAMAALLGGVGLEPRAELGGCPGGPGPPAVRWVRWAPIGDPARNLFLAGLVATACGRPEVGRGYVEAAARLGLPEALGLVGQALDP